MVYMPQLSLAFSLTAVTNESLQLCT